MIFDYFDSQYFRPSDVRPLFTFRIHISLMISPQVMFASPNTNISYYHYTGEGGDTAWLQHHRLRDRQEISLYAMVSSHWSRAGHVTS